MSPVSRRRHHRDHRQRLDRPEERRRCQRRTDPRRRTVRHPGRPRLHRHRQGCRRPVRRPRPSGPERAPRSEDAEAAPPGFAAALALSATLASARAQQLDLAHGGPIAITASEGIEWRQEQREVIARGNARAVGQNVTVTADRLIAFYRPKNGAAAQPTPPAQPPPSVADWHGHRGQRDLSRAGGRERADLHPTDQAQGDRAVYDIDQAVLVMTGRDAEADHAERCADRAGRSGILVAEAHGSGTRQCRRGDQRRAADRGRYAGRLHHRRRHRSSALARQPPAELRDDPLAASGKLQKVEAFGNVTVRTADRHRDRRSGGLCAGHRHRPAGWAGAHHARAEPARWVGGGGQHEDRHLASAAGPRRARAGPGAAERRHQPAVGTPGQAPLRQPPK